MDFYKLLYSQIHSMHFQNYFNVSDNILILEKMVMDLFCQFGRELVFASAMWTACYKIITRYVAKADFSNLTMNSLMGGLGQSDCGACFVSFM